MFNRASIQNTAESQRKINELVSYFQKFCEDAHLSLFRFINKQKSSSAKKLIETIIHGMEDRNVQPLMIALSNPSASGKDNALCLLLKKLKLQPFLNRTYEACPLIQFPENIATRMNALMASKAQLDPEAFQQEIDHVIMPLSQDKVRESVAYLALNYGCQSLEKLEDASFVLYGLLLPSQLYCLVLPEDQIIQALDTRHTLHKKFVQAYRPAIKLAEDGYIPLDPRAGMLHYLNCYVGNMDAVWLAHLIKHSRIAEAQKFLQDIPAKHETLEYILRSSVIMAAENGVLQADEPEVLFKDQSSAVKDKFVHDVITLFLPLFLEENDQGGDCFSFFAEEVMWAYKQYGITSNPFEVITKQLMPLIKAETKSEHESKLLEYQEELDLAYHHAAQRTDDEKEEEDNDHAAQ